MNENELTVQDEQESLFSGLPTEYIEQLNPAKMRVLMLYLTGHYTMQKIAQTVGVSSNTIRAWLMQPAMQECLKILQEREFAIIDAQLKQMRFKAVDTMHDLMDSPIDQVRLGASKDVLDRTGHKAMQQIKVDKTVTSIEQQLQSLADFTIDDSEVIDITDAIELIKNE